MSYEIKEDFPAPSTTPKANQVAQSTGHAYISELSIAQEDLKSLSHRLQFDSHIEYPWYKKLNRHVLPSTPPYPTSNNLDKCSSALYSTRNTSINVT